MKFIDDRSSAGRYKLFVLIQSYLEWPRELRIEKCPHFLFYLNIVKYFYVVPVQIMVQGM